MTDSDATTAALAQALGRAPSTAVAIANEFIDMGMAEPNFPPIDQMKLQKLLYYSHAWYLAYFDRPLFEEDLEAWPWGPVVRDVYSQTKKFGKFPVSEKLYEISKIGDKPSDFGFVIPAKPTDTWLTGFIRAIWDTHKSFTGIQLSNSTHAPGEPWTIVNDQYGGDLSCKPTIPNGLIESVFKKKIAIDTATNNTAAN